MLSTEFSRADRDPQRVLEEFFLWCWKAADNAFWQHMEELERHKTALSDHLLTVFTNWGKSFVGVTPEFELFFERFEILAALSYLDTSETADIKAALSKPASGNCVPMPVGRSGWHSGVRNRLIKEIQGEGMTKAILDAGFARGSKKHLELALANFLRIAAQMEW